MISDGVKKVFPSLQEVTENENRAVLFLSHTANEASNSRTSVFISRPPRSNPSRTWMENCQTGMA